MRKKNMEALLPRILDLLSHTESNAISGSDIMAYTGLTRREVTDLMVKLRETYPVCSKVHDGGGYWIATTNNEISRYIGQLDRRISGIKRTMALMTEHIN